MESKTTTVSTHNGEKSADASNSKSQKHDGDATCSGEKVAAFFHIVNAMHEARKGTNGALTSAAEDLLVSRLEARSTEFRDPMFLNVCDKETAIHNLCVILDTQDDSSETMRQLMTTFKVIKVFLEHAEFESSPAPTSEPTTATSVASAKETPPKKPKQKVVAEADESGSAEEDKEKKKKKKKKESKKTVVEEPKKKKDTEAVTPTKKRKARKSDSESEESVEKKREGKKRRCEEDKDASKTKPKDDTTAAAKSKTPATPRAKKRENELFVLRDGAKIAPLFINEKQTLTNFVPADAEQDDSSVFVWSTETYEGDKKDLNIFHKKIVFSKRWFAVDIRDANRPKLTLKSLTKTEMKKRGCSVTKSDIEDKFVALVRKYNLVKPSVTGGEESDDGAYEKTGKEAKKFMAALRKKNGEFQTQLDPYWRIDRKVDENNEDATFWTTLTELLPSKIRQGGTKPSKYAEFEDHAGKKYAKYTIPEDIKYDSEGTAIWMPVYLENAFTNTRKLTSEPCNGFISTSAWYFDTEEAFEKACERLREISAALSDINPPAKSAKKAAAAAANKKTTKAKSTPVVEKSKKGKKSEPKEEKKSAKKKAKESMDVESSAEEKKAKADKKSKTKKKKDANESSVESSEQSKKSKPSKTDTEPKSSSKKSDKSKKKRSSSSSSSKSDDS